jgi:DNA polymerase-3 subunit alpha
VRLPRAENAARSITDARALIHQHTPDFDINKIPLNDQATFDIYNRGETIAVFQVESGG